MSKHGGGFGVDDARRKNRTDAPQEVPMLMMECFDLIAITVHASMDILQLLYRSTRNTIQLLARASWQVPSWPSSRQWLWK
jgi:hypothetical protein